MKWRLGCLFVGVFVSCKSSTSPADASQDVSVASALDAGLSRQVPALREPTTQVPRVEPLAVCDHAGRLPLHAAQEYFDSGQFEKALSCAAQASALEPGSVPTHVERALALTALKRFDEAKQAFARALALNPDDSEALLGAARLFGMVLPSNHDNDALASLYADRGFENAPDEDVAVEFARLGAVILNDLGLSTDALERADFVLARIKGDPDASYERALALFELCRFSEAKKAFTALVKDPEREAHARHHLGLILEREGNAKEAQSQFKAAAALLPQDFPSPVLWSAADFDAFVKKSLASLPADMRRDVEGVPVTTEDVPADADLRANEPPLSPTILGLFRGVPLSEACDADAGQGLACRSLVLYRKNLGRAVRTDDELREQVRVTLLHEIGHLRGEDDVELAARGLE